MYGFLAPRTFIQTQALNTALTLNNSPLAGDLCWENASPAYLDDTSLPRGLTKPEY